MGNRSETQQKILDAAIKIFAARGYHGATTAEIAQEAKVAEGTVFKYYKTKKLLLKAVLEFFIHEAAPLIMKCPYEEMMKNCELENAKSVVKKLLLEKVELVNQNINCLRIMVTELQYHEDLKQEYLGRVVPGFIGFLEKVYESGIKNGIFKDMNCHTAARSFMGMLVILMMDKNLMNKQMDMEKEIDSILDIYLNGTAVKGENHA